jgi:hypothetical protein
MAKRDILSVQDPVATLGPAVHQATGMTTAERYLAQLCKRSFLSLWSYPGVFRDQGDVVHGGDGKEVCDLLVVFEDHVIIFSDKDCAFPDTGDSDRDWARWYRRAVRDAAKQLWGAERWIETYPNRLFLDRACKHPFPFELPSSGLTFHRVVVAHGAAARSRAALGGSGSLMIMPSITGDEHMLPAAQGGRPFAVGQVDPAKGFLHVLDDASLEIVLSTLDTITDFVEYLSRKEILVRSGRLCAAAGEEDLLAFYLSRLDQNGAHDFVLPSEIDEIVIDEGLWEDFAQSPERAGQLAANEISYRWDALIETFARYIIEDTQYYRTHEGIANQEKIVRFPARENRTRRRLLSNSLVSFIESIPASMKAARVVLPSKAGDPYYVFLLLPHLSSIQSQEYREVRRTLLGAYCSAVKLKYPEAEDIVGIATETGIGEFRSEDVAFLDARQWSEAEYREAQEQQEGLELLRDTTKFTGTVYEYPPTASPRTLPHYFAIKGRHRNEPCPCGSGMKAKRCCGQ